MKSTTATSTPVSNPTIDLANVAPTLSGSLPDGSCPEYRPGPWDRSGLVCMTRGVRTVTFGGQNGVPKYHNDNPFGPG